MAVYTREAQKMLIRAAAICEQVNGGSPEQDSPAFQAVEAALREALALTVRAVRELKIEHRALTAGRVS